MKISVITPSFNQRDFIEQTIRSVLDQEMDHELEHLIIDGGSNDGTIEILNKYNQHIIWISEPDNGQADAVNKGFRLASGDIIGWLNSDDLYLPGALQKVADYFTEHPDCKWLYGKCKIIDQDGKEIWKWITGYKNLGLRSYSYKRLLAENYISQPAVFFRKELIDELGSLNTGLDYAMDYDLWLRFGQKYPAGVINEYLSAFRRHSKSKSETDFTSQFLEQYMVAKKRNPGKMILSLHKFNIYKIIVSYRVMNMFKL